jgi:hypothetical protein
MKSEGGFRKLRQLCRTPDVYIFRLASITGLNYGGTVPDCHTGISSTQYTSLVCRSEGFRGCVDVARLIALWLEVSYLESLHFAYYNVTCRR